MAAIASDKSIVEENLPPVLDPTAEQPPLFDGTIRLYTYYSCPYAQRVWIVRNYKGLQDKIKLVPLTLMNRPSWFAKKVYSVNKVPALEHNGKIMGESLDLMKYLDSNFKGPSLLPDVDIAYVPFVERFEIHLSVAFNYDITAGRPKLAAWIQEMNEIRAYKQTKTDPEEVVAFYTKRLQSLIS